MPPLEVHILDPLLTEAIKGIHDDQSFSASFAGSQRQQNKPGFFQSRAYI